MQTPGVTAVEREPRFTSGRPCLASPLGVLCGGERKGPPPSPTSLHARRHVPKRLLAPRCSAPSEPHPERSASPGSPGAGLPGRSQLSTELWKKPVVGSGLRPRARPLLLLAPLGPLRPPQGAPIRTLDILGRSGVAPPSCTHGLQSWVPTRKAPWKRLPGACSWGSFGVRACVGGSSPDNWGLWKGR